MTFMSHLACSVQLDHGNNTTQSDTGNSISIETSSIRTNMLRFARNDRLPVAVLLARERLLERLRVVSLFGNKFFFVFLCDLVVDEVPFWQKPVKLGEENGDDSAADEDIEVERMMNLEQL
ncbi:hypothetical protein HHK36_009818 [Tetracentron sinense]|uniref:Uncharacterized protein n=1 Tax=Tetracentron sinense TaxID=13715 RepID=A0A835DIJ5_TETSI|nr:hypothetical protein HHK36_009818 [Tetracentron sinense]